MGEFDLDLQAIEQQLPEEEETNGTDRRVVLDVLDGTTDDGEWTRLVREGHVLVLNVEGDLNELAAGFAEPIRNEGGTLMHFRGFLIVAPSGMGIDPDRLRD